MADDNPIEEKPSECLIEKTVGGNLVQQVQLTKLAQGEPSPTSFSDPIDVLESLADQFLFKEEGLGGKPRGLRIPQIGAVHSVLGYWATSPSHAATVVMPTGTGKTDTMVALLAAARLARVLVIVPTTALRDQLSEKFLRYGVLPRVGALGESVRLPVIGKVEHRFDSTHDAIEFASCCNVVVATVSALRASVEDVRRAFLAEFTHLFADEAHHIPAKQWDSIRASFDDGRVVQFTATPFRADGKHLGGRIVFAFPLREAQRQDYFSRIKYVPITDFADPDRRIAETAVAQLRSDRAAGLDHVLMARVATKKRADELINLYLEIAPEFSPVKLHSGESLSARRRAREGIASRENRIIVCVDMLGEGYDLPELKVAAIHDAHKTLPVTLQFVGRFTRTNNQGRIGDATVVVNRPDPDYDESLRKLYADDADWNYLIQEVAEGAVGEQQEISDFEQGFGSSIPDEVPIRTLAPKMSTVVYRTDCTYWNPEAATAYFGEENLLTSSLALNAQRHVAWFVTKERSPVRWGRLNTVEEVAYHFYAIYWDQARGLLYINSSNTDGVYKRLAQAVCEDSAEIIKGEVIYRVMAKLNRLVPTNVGLVDVRSRARRFSMHVGADVTEGFPTAEAQTKTKTNIFAFGYEEGRRVGYGGSLKGRIWSNRTANSLAHWVDWCNVVGAKVLDESISVDAVMQDFIRPEEVKSRPALVALGVDWPLDFYMTTTEQIKLSYEGVAFDLAEVELSIAEFNKMGPVVFQLATPTWQAVYEATFSDQGISYLPRASEVTWAGPRKRYALSEVFTSLGLRFYFEDETTIEGGEFLLRPPRNTPPFRRDKLIVKDWLSLGVNIRNESQGPDKKSDSIQYWVIHNLLADHQWDVVIDDDSAGEAADVVALRKDDQGIVVRLIHCKFSGESEPGARVDDLYELCGQAHKSVRWRRTDDLIRHLIRRERNRQGKYGRVGFEVGDETKLRQLQDVARTLHSRLEIVLVQPGLSAEKAKDEHLQLLACTEVYVHETAMAKFTVVCSS